jgi:DnaD/phage-associated family protein
LFDKTLFEKYNILTSPRIQRQYFDVVKRRECVNVVGDYILLEKNSLPKNVNIFAENADINAKNADGNATSKVKVSEVKPSEVKKSAAAVCPNGEKTAATAATADLFDYYEKNIGGMSPEIVSNIASYRRIFSDELIIFAIRQAVEANVKNWRYIHAILQRYKKDGVDSPQKAEIRKKVEYEPFPVRQNSFNCYEQREYDDEDYERIIAEKEKRRQAAKQAAMFIEGD